MVNLFRDQIGREIVVITSPGKLLSGDVEIIVRGSSFGPGLHAVVVRPGERLPTPLDAVRVNGHGDVILTTSLGRGAAVVQLSK